MITQFEGVDFVVQHTDPGHVKYPKQTGNLLLEDERSKESLECSDMSLMKEKNPEREG